jgi:hypothetical protein
VLRDPIAAGQAHVKETTARRLPLVSLLVHSVLRVREKKVT